ncbi:ATP-binding protein [Actinoplanes sp. CA-015351]|uniref:ATP-binding protein n=1 Tax=Actinoplanes sp. CA-015351 TaxID=3239897 RepID=UPI003D9917F3
MHRGPARCAAHDVDRGCKARRRGRYISEGPGVPTDSVRILYDPVLHKRGVCMAGNQPSDLVGRTHELSVLNALLDQETASPARPLLVRGPAGAGKSALLNACADSATHISVRAVLRRKPASTAANPRVVVVVAVVAMRFDCFELALLDVVHAAL